MDDKEFRIEQMTQDLEEVLGTESAALCAEVAVGLGYRKERYGIWILDETFVSKVKKRYICSACGHWVVVKYQNSETMLYRMKYCNGCGAKMISVKNK